MNETKPVDITPALARKLIWDKLPVWVHGDIAIGNIFVQNNKLSAIIDFGGAAVGDPACDLMIAWTYFSENAREIFIETVKLDKATWLRAKAWALWKATFELCQIQNKQSPEAHLQQRIINEVIHS